MDGTLFTERGEALVMQRKEDELVSGGYKKVENTHPFRLRVWEYTIQDAPGSRGSPPKQIIYWMKPDEKCLSRR